MGDKQVAQDKTLVCADCGSEFTFTEGEQQFFTERGFSEPIRCKPCRDVRKSQKATRGGTSGGGGGFGGGGSDRRDRW
jgi:hypothetical protein